MKIMVMPDHYEVNTVKQLQLFVKDRIIKVGDIVDIQVPMFETDKPIIKGLKIKNPSNR